MFDALESEQYGTSFGRENGTVILNAMTVAVINENCCYRDPLSVFRTVSVEWDGSWESISYGGFGEILIVVGGVSDFLDAASFGGTILMVCVVIRRRSTHDRRHTMPPPIASEVGTLVVRDTDIPSPPISHPYKTVTEALRSLQMAPYEHS